MRGPVSSGVDSLPEAYPQVCSLASTYLDMYTYINKEMEYGVLVKKMAVGFYEEFTHVSVATSSQRCFLSFLLFFWVFLFKKLFII